jgi:large conductance mechanosensitive channel
MVPPLNIMKPSWVDEFRSFIMRGNVVDLAVGVVIGAAFTAIVGSVIKDLFNPLIGLLLGGIDFSNIFITLKGPSAPTLEAAKTAGAVTLNIGLFINAVIQFLIIAFAVFWLVKMVSMLQRTKEAAPAAPPAPSKSEVLLTEIRDLLAGQAPKA